MSAKEKTKLSIDRNLYDELVCYCYLIIDIVIRLLFDQDLLVLLFYKENNFQILIDSKIDCTVLYKK